MITVEIREGEEYIKLGQALKKAGIAVNGSDAKNLIVSGHVEVNGITETRRGRKLYPGDTACLNGETLFIGSIR